ncbi:MAG: type II toxin-antitoxin system VapC family toxin [Pseudomonas sp.]
MGLIYLDTCLVIYAFEQHPVHGERVLRALESESQDRFAISPLVHLECLVAPMRDGNLVLQRYYEEGLRQFVLLDMPVEVYQAAAQLRARFALRTPDALHLAVAQHHRCDALWTGDSRLARAAHGLSVDLLG